jgi:uncharacterized protein YyaL (SSP411 family)
MSFLCGSLKDDQGVQAVEKKWETLMDYGMVQGRLVHIQYENGSTRPAVSTDYSYLLWLTLELFHTTTKKVYWEVGLKIMQEWKEGYWEEQGYFRQTRRGTDHLPVVLGDLRDGATPSAQGVGRYLLAILALVTGDKEYEQMYRQLIGYTEGEIEGESGRAVMSFWWAHVEEKKIRKIQTTHLPTKEEQDELRRVEEERGEYWYVITGDESCKEKGYQYCGKEKCYPEVGTIREIGI